MKKRFKEYKLFVQTLLKSDLKPVEKRSIFSQVTPIYRREYLTDVSVYSSKLVDHLREEFDEQIGLYQMELDSEVSFFLDFAKMKYFQCELSQNGSKMTAWIEDKGAKQGCRVKITDLEAENKYWQVDKVYNPGMEKDEFKQRQDLQRKWHNNI